MSNAHSRIRRPTPPGAGRAGRRGCGRWPRCGHGRGARPGPPVQARPEAGAARAREVASGRAVEHDPALRRRLDQLRGEVATLRNREAIVQAELEKKEAELKQAKNRLEVLRVRLKRSLEVLRERLVAIYESSQPDALTVILESNGFDDLLEPLRVPEADPVPGQLDRGAGPRPSQPDQGHGGAGPGGARRDRRQEGRARADPGRARGPRRRTWRRRASRTSRPCRRSRTPSSSSRATSATSRARSRPSSGGRRRRVRAGGGPGRPGPGRELVRVHLAGDGPITSPFCEPRPWEACHPGIDIGVPDRHPDPGRRRRHRRDRRARRAATATTPASTTAAGSRAATRTRSRSRSRSASTVSQGQVIGIGDCTGLLLRRPPPLRGAGQRPGRRPDGLPALGANRPARSQAVRDARGRRTDLTGAFCDSVRCTLRSIRVQGSGGMTTYTPHLHRLAARAICALTCVPTWPVPARRPR